MRSIFAPSHSRSRCRSRNAIRPLDEPQALPNAVAEHEAGIEHGDLRFRPPRERAVDADQHRVVARVADIVLRAGGLSLLRVPALISPECSRRLQHGEPLRPRQGSSSPADPALPSPVRSGREGRAVGAFAAIGGHGHEAGSGHRMADHWPCRGGRIVLAAVQGVARAVLCEPARGHHRSIPPTRWLLACVSTSVAYAALAWYDRIALLHLGRRIGWPFVALTSFTTYAIAHNIGASVFSGAVIRYRAYSTRGLSPSEVGLLVAFCSFTFALGAATLGGLLLAFSPWLVERFDAAPLWLGHAGGAGPARRAGALCHRLAAAFPSGQARRLRACLSAPAHRGAPVIGRAA